MLKQHKIQRLKKTAKNQQGSKGRKTTEAVKILFQNQHDTFKS